MLGPVEAQRDGGVLGLGGIRQRAVVARLLVAGQEVVPVDRLLDDLWEGSPPRAALGVLQAYVSNLRRVLEPDRAPRSPASLLVSRAPGYVLQCPSDADRFVSLLTTGSERLALGDGGGAVAALDEGLALWRGGAYADFADEAWAQPEIVRLGELRLVAREQRFAAALVLGESGRLVPDLEQLAGEFPLREGLWRLLALALYRSGRHPEALVALRRCRDTLRVEFGLDPSASLLELEQSILVQDPSLGQTVPLPVSPVPSAVQTEVRDNPDAPRRAVFGRETAMAELRSAAAEALTGRPGMVVVAGEAGIGKSWLVETFAAELAERGWRPLWGRCHDTSGAPALWPWLQVFEELEATVALPPVLRDLLDGQGEAASTSMTARDARFRQHEAVRRYLLDAAGSAPVLVVLEDLQWADAASAQLLADVFSVARSGRLLLLATTRAPELQQQVMHRLDRAGGRRVALSGLGPQHLADLAAIEGHVLAGDLLHARTGGNPYLARETLRLVGQVGAERALTQVPDGVGELVRQRYAILGPEAQTMLQAAAVLGRDIDLDLLREVSGQAEEEVWDGVDAAVLTGVLVQGRAGTFEFTHDLLREVIYADLAPLRRSRLHARVVQVLESRALPDVSRLAEHAYAAGSLARGQATRWSVAAAEQAHSRLAHEDAARWWGRAVESHAAQPDADPGEGLNLLMSQLGSQLDSGDATGARRTRNRAILAADLVDDLQAGDRALLALDAPALWLLRQFDEVEIGVVHRLENSLARLPRSDSPARCRVLAALAVELYEAEVDPRCDQYSGQALAMARRLNDPALVAVALNARYVANNRDAHPDDMPVLASELVRLGADQGWPSVALLGEQMSSIWCLDRADLTAADAHATAAARLIRRLDLQLPRMQALSYTITRLQLAGRFTDSSTAIDQFAELGLNWWAFDGLLAAMRLTQLFVAGRLTEAHDDVIQAAGRARPSLAHDVLVIRSADRGLAVQPSGWPVPARDWGWLSMMMVRASAAGVGGDTELRRSVYTQLLPFAGRIAHSSGFGMPVDWALAELATALLEPDAARSHLAALEGLAIRESLDWWADRARTASLALS